MRWIAVMGLVVLAGCREEAGTGADPCGAGEYAGLVGTSVAAVTLPASLDARVLGPDDAATMDHVPTRLNVRTGADGVVLSLDCG